MTYLDVRAVPCRPMGVWSRIHRWGGAALFGFACFGAGHVISTSYYNITHLWGVVGKETAGKASAPIAVTHCAPPKHSP